MLMLTRPRLGGYTQWVHLEVHPSGTNFKPEGWLPAKSRLYTHDNALRHETETNRAKLLHNKSTTRVSIDKEIVQVLLRTVTFDLTELCESASCPHGDHNQKDWGEFF